MFSEHTQSAIRVSHCNIHIEAYDSYQTTHYQDRTSLTQVILSHQHQQTNILLVWYCFKARVWQLHEEKHTTKRRLSASTRETQWLTRPMRLKELLALGADLQCPSFFSWCEAAPDTNEHTQTHPAGNNKIRSEIKSKKECRHFIPFP